MSDSIAALIDSFGKPYRSIDKKDEAVLKLRSIGSPAVMPLIEALTAPTVVAAPAVVLTFMEEEANRQSMCQLYAARTLGLMGKLATRAAPALADLFAKSPTSLIKREAALALGRIGPVQDQATTADVIYLMTSALNGTGEFWHVDVREAAAIALGMYGMSAKSAVPSLIACLMDRTDRVRDAAHQALERMGAAAFSVMLEAVQSRQRIRAELAQKGILVLGAWAKTFEVPDAPPGSWQARQQVEYSLLVEKMLEGCLQILVKSALRMPEVRPMLSEIAKGDANERLQSIARQALEPQRR